MFHRGHFGLGWRHPHRTQATLSNPEDYLSGTHS